MTIEQMLWATIGVGAVIITLVIIAFRLVLRDLKHKPSEFYDEVSKAVEEEMK